MMFLVFFALVYGLYLAMRPWHRLQNALLLVASCIFYGFWDWRFLFLLALSTGIDFVAGLIIDSERPERVRRAALTASVVSNLGILGFFKYFNFFTDNAVRLLAWLGLHADFVTLHIVLPVGISFYTFQAMSYTIDVYRGKLASTRNFWDFALVVLFFPHLVAGPIVRASYLLPQVQNPRRLDAGQVDAGIFLILWGYFKKLVIADNLALIANNVFDNYQHMAGLDLLVGMLAFTFQIYGDFSGYTDIARGLAKVMGFELGLNFNLPYLARNPSDFWQRWHISLSSWLRDYLYISLGGNRRGRWMTYRNLMITMLLGGLWHGAAWNFVVWGAYHGTILVLFHWFDADDGRLGALRTGMMFCLTVVGWVFFRSHSMHQALYILLHGGLARSASYGYHLLYGLLFFSAPLLIVQLIQWRRNDLMAIVRLHFVPRLMAYSVFMFGIFIFGVRTASEFIYFQF